MDEFVGCLGAVVLMVVLFLIAPVIGFFCAWVGGWICSLVIGNQLCYALNVLFDTTRFVPEMLPWIGGALGFIGGYFKSYTANTSKK